MQAGLRRPAGPARGLFATLGTVAVVGTIAAGALVPGAANPAGAAEPAPAPSADAGVSEPLWRQGISTWHGDHYELPERQSDPPDAAPRSVYQVRPAAGPSGDRPAPVPADGSVPITAPANALPPQRATSPSPPPASRVPPSRLSPDAAPATESVLAAPAWPTAPLPGGPERNDPADEAALPIGEQVESGQPAEEPPLEDAIVQWYQYPWLWVSEGWDNHIEFGLDGSSGNSETLAIQTGLEMERKTDAYTLSIDLDYRQASNREGTTEDNGRFNLDYDRLLGESRWSWFHKFGLEWDRFKAFDLRLNANSGLGYHWIRTERSSLVTRFGAGTSKEFGSPDDPWVPEAVFGIEAEHQLTARQKLLGKLEYFPAWNDFSDYRLVTDLGWEMLLDDSENLSLKLALTDRYDSTPQGAEANDVYYSLLLLYKF